MTYKEIKRRVLEHINRATIAGSEVSPAYNCQSDDLMRIPGLINEAVVSIRTLARPETGVFVPGEGERMYGMRKYDLPEDYRSMKGGGVYQVKDGQMESFGGWRLFGSRAILLPEGEFLVEYCRYPDLLPEDPEEDFDYVQDVEVLYAAIYYAAANLVMLEDEFVYSALMRDYENRFARMITPVACTTGSVGDMYASFGGDGL